MRESDKTIPRDKEVANRDNQTGKPKEGRLEKIARVIDPIAPDLRDQDLSDPGRMTPGAPPTDNRS